jgi:hypothetical protein
VIAFGYFTYSDVEWDAIKAVVQRVLGHDADHLVRRIPPGTGVDTRAPLSLQGMAALVTALRQRQQGHDGEVFLRDRIEDVIDRYRLMHSGADRTSGEQLGRLRADVEALRERVIATMTTPLVIQDNPAVHSLRRPDVDSDLPAATHDYFTRVGRDLDRQLAQAKRRQDSARKAARNHCWEELLTIWCELRGQPHGAGAADFLMTTTLPVMFDEVPRFRSVLRWLARRFAGIRATINP